MLATASAVKEGLLSLSRREIGGFRSAAEAAKDMMQEASPNKRPTRRDRKLFFVVLPIRIYRYYGLTNDVL